MSDLKKGEAIVSTTIGTLRIHFGGLCMFVQRPEGLFVLMPNMTMHHERHWPVMILKSGNTRLLRSMHANAVLYPLLGRKIDTLRTILPSRDALDIRWALNVSEYMGGVPVADRWLREDPKGKLACRVSLPRGYGPEVEGGTPGSIRVDGWPVPVAVQSLSYVTLDLSKLNIETLTLAEATVYPDPKHGDADVYIYNIRLAELQRDSGADTPNRTHWAGQELYHPRAYYDLLDLGDGSAERPRFTVAADLPGGDDALLQDLQCPASPIALDDFTPPTKGSRFVDTHDCSHGLGI